MPLQQSLTTLTLSSLSVWPTESRNFPSHTSTPSVSLTWNTHHKIWHSSKIHTIQLTLTEKTHNSSWKACLHPVRLDQFWQELSQKYTFFLRLLWPHKYCTACLPFSCVHINTNNNLKYRPKKYDTIPTYRPHNWHWQKIYTIQADKHVSTLSD